MGFQQPGAYEHKQHIGINNQTGQLESFGINVDYFTEFLTLENLSNVVKTDADRQYVMDFIKENVGVERVRSLIHISCSCDSLILY